MRVGIDGMGRIGRLTLRAAMGGFSKTCDDPRANNRLDVVRANEIKGDAGSPIAHAAILAGGASAAGIARRR